MAAQQIVNSEALISALGKHSSKGAVFSSKFI